MSMYDVCRAIADKYAALPPDPDYPLYGDMVRFRDKYNGREYSGIVLGHCEGIPIFWKPWRVEVRVCHTDGTVAFPPLPVMHVDKDEIIKVTRADGSGEWTKEEEHP